MDTYILLARDDSSMVILGPDESGDLEVREQGERLNNGKWLSGSLYDDTNDIFRLQYDDDEEEEPGTVLMFLLSTNGGLHVSPWLERLCQSHKEQVYRLPNLRNPVYVAEGLSFVPPFLSNEFTVRRSTARDPLSELMVTDLGDGTHKAPYLIVSPISFTLSLCNNLIICSFVRQETTSFYTNLIRD